MSLFILGKQLSYELIPSDDSQIKKLDNELKDVYG